jgi:hypothetical protein
VPRYLILLVPLVSSSFADMLTNCRVSCYQCSNELWSEEELSNGSDMGEPQQLVVDDAEKGTRAAEDIPFLISKARKYMRTVVTEKFEFGMNEICWNKHENCSFWALFGECEANPECEFFICARLFCVCGVT